MAKSVRRILVLAALCAYAPHDAIARPTSDWNEFEAAHGCEYDIMLFCEGLRPKTDAVLDCLQDNYVYLSIQCWHDLDFFAKKFPHSRWSRFERK